jgi:hypothetical protein
MLGGYGSATGPSEQEGYVQVFQEVPHQDG